MKSSLIWFVFLAASLCATVTLGAPVQEKDSRTKGDGELARVVDEFDKRHSLDWTIRNPDPDHFSYEKKAGTLTIMTQQGGLFKEAKNYNNLFLLSNPLEGGGDFEVTTCLVGFKPTASWQQAGLICFDDEDNYVKFVLQYGQIAPHYKLCLARETRGEIIIPQRIVSLPRVPERLWLRLTKRGNRYAFATSTDGQSFHVHGERPWGNGAPKSVGLIAKNGHNATEASVEASFDMFIMRERASDEPPVYLYAFPSGGNVDDMLSFIENLREYQPPTPQAQIEYNRRAPALLQTAARRIMQLEKDQWSKAYQTALLVFLEERIRRIPSASPQQRQQTIDLVKMLLVAKTDEGKIPLETRDVDLCFSVGDVLEQQGQFDLAAQAYRDFAEVVANDDQADHDEMVATLQGAARRLSLKGQTLDLTVFATGKTPLDDSAYVDKATLVLFWSLEEESSLIELRHAKLLYSLYHDRGFEVLAVCVDPRTQGVEHFLEKQCFPWKTLLAENSKTRHPAVQQYGVVRTPTALLVDREGKVVSLRLLAESLDQRLAELLGPPRVPVGELTHVNLPSKANQKLTEKLHNAPGNDLSELPRGQQTFGGVEFSISDAVIQLWGQHVQDRPAKIEGLSVDAYVDNLHFLHGTGWTAEDGAVIAKYLVHYEGGQVETIPMVYGKDVRNWYTANDPLAVDGAVAAWIGSNRFVRMNDTAIRLYLGTWKNPRPDQKVLHIDVVSGKTTAAPFCVAITSEQVNADDAMH